MSIYMLDTDTCSYVIRNNPKSVAEALVRHENDDICISVVTYAELLYGIQKHGSHKLARTVRSFVDRLEIVEWTREAAAEYADIRCLIEAKGTPLNGADLMIAACAKTIGAILVTNNVKHFEKIPALKIENWS